MTKGKATQSPRNQYKSLTHVSDVLWHFIGPGGCDEYSVEKAIARFESYIPSSGDGLTLEPYKKNGEHYRRILSFTEAGFGVGKAADLTDVRTYEVLEPKAVCFCDIPISHLPVHMGKYGDIGVGVRRRVIYKEPSFGVMPVRYFPLVSVDQFESENNRLWKKRGTSIELDPFTKIPTNLDESTEPPTSHNAELFESIYEEREWRTTGRITLSMDEIAFILLPSRIHVDVARFPKTVGLITKGVGLIIADDLFRLEQRQVIEKQGGAS